MTPAAPRLLAVPGVVLLAMLVVCIATREWYPFTPFPMYAAFGGTTWHLRLTDGDDTPISPLQVFGVSAIPLRRMFERRAIVEQQHPEPAAAEARAADALLRFLVAEARPQPGAPPPPPRLRRSRISSKIEGGRVVSTRDLLSEIACP
ncbi:MAG: hypothetical protein ABI629_10370 [bacterium]